MANPKRWRTVYAVAAGQYSDYKISTLFEDEADAEAWADRLNRTDKREYDDERWRVEEFDFFPSGVVPEMVARWTAYATAPDWKIGATSWLICETSPEIQQLSRPQVFENKTGDGVGAYALDRTAAIKAASDRIASKKAAAQGL